MAESGGAYDTIRKRIITGAYPPGSQVKVNETAASLRLSPTPVREALSRLVGEALLEDRRRFGFFMPSPSYFEIVDLLLFSELCLVQAIGGTFEAPRRLGAEPAAEGGATAGPEVWADYRDDRAGALFARLLGRSGNGEIVRLGTLALDRLAGVRAAERCIVGGREDELAAMSALLPTRHDPALVQKLREWHRVSRSHAAELAHMLAHGPSRH